MNKLYNLARVTTSTTGTGTITLGTAVSSGFCTFAQAGVQDGEVVTYAIEDANGNREIGKGTYTASGTTLSRDTVYLSTGGGTSKISLSGSAQVFITVAAEDLSAFYSSNGILKSDGAGTITAASYEGDVPIAAAHIDLDFVNGIYWNAPNNPVNPFTVTRAGTAYIDDTSGNWTAVAANTLRQSNKGALIEESRTNMIRNNSMQGAVVASPGTLPTNWSIVNTFGALTRTIVGVGTENGVDYIDIRWNGTTSSTNASFGPETPASIAATNGQKWSYSAFVSLRAGSLTNLTGLDIGVFGSDSGGGFLFNTITSIFSSLNSTLTRYTKIFTINNASTAFIWPKFGFGWTSGVAVDFTLRIGWPQLEQAESVSSPIRTTSATVTRAADVVTMNLPPTFGSSMSIAASGSPLTATTYSLDQFICQIDDTSGNNQFGLVRNSTTGNGEALLVVGGTTVFDTQATMPAWAQTTNGIVTSAITANSYVAAFDGGPAFYGSINLPSTIPTMTTARIGAQQSPANYWNGYITRILIWPEIRLGDQVVVDIAGALPVADGHATNLFNSTGTGANLYFDRPDQSLIVGDTATAIANASYQTIIAGKSTYTEIGVYGNLPSTTDYAAIAHDSTFGYVYSNIASLVLQSGNTKYTILSPGTGITKAFNVASNGQAQSLYVYNTTDSEAGTNSEWADVSWVSNVLYVGTNKAGTGTTRNMQFNIGGTNKLDYGITNASKWTFADTIVFPTSFVLGATTVTTTGTQLNYLNAATGTTGTTSANLVFSTSPVLITPNIGTPSAGTLTNCTGLPVTGVSGLGTGVATFLATPSSANLRAALTDEVGTGAAYFVGGALGTPASGTLTNCTGLPVSTGVSGLGTNVATFLATPSSANLIATITDETGSGSLVFATSPTIIAPLTKLSQILSVQDVSVVISANYGVIIPDAFEIASGIDVEIGAGGNLEIT